MPFFFFAPRRLRLFACGLTVCLQVADRRRPATTPSSTCSPSRSPSCCSTTPRFPRRWRERPSRGAQPAGPGRERPRSRRGGAARRPPPRPSSRRSGRAQRDSRARWSPCYRASAPLRSANGYGLFAVMTTARPEIVVEGSDDGATLAKPTSSGGSRAIRARRPSFVAPHQPRLDWQMWFAALGQLRGEPVADPIPPEAARGVARRCEGCSRGSLPGRPPRFVRAVALRLPVHDAPPSAAATGAWWRREARGLYCPVLSEEGGAIVGHGSERGEAFRSVAHDRSAAPAPEPPLVARRERESSRLLRA